MARGKISAAAAVLLSCACMSPALAQGATIVVDGDDGTPDAAGCGAPANPCDTIQGGVDMAARADTVRVLPSSGRYIEAVRISVDDLKLVGPREGVDGELRGGVPDLTTEAVVDAPGDAPAAITVDATGVRIDGLYFAGSATAPEDGFAAVEFTTSRGEARNNVIADYAPGLRLTGDHHLVSRNLFLQDEANDSAYGVMADTPLADLAVRQNRFEGHDDAIVLAGAERKEGVEILDNTIAGLSGDGTAMDLAGLAAASSVRGNVVLGTGTGIAVSGADGLRIDANTISGTAEGITVDGAPDLPASRDVSIIRNQLLDFGDAAELEGAGVAIAAGVLGTDLVVVANRFEARVPAVVPAIVAGPQGDGSRVLAANNWWGCTGGANAQGCAVTAGPGIVTTPWLVLSAAAIPSDTPAPGSLRLSADIQRNSAGQDVAEVALLGPLPFAFEKVVGPGALGATESLGGGAAQSAIESAVPGHAVVRALLDAASADIALEFTATPPAPVVPAIVDLAPWLRKVRFAPKTFARPRGTTFHFELSEAATVRLVLVRMAKGRLAAGRCIKPAGNAREVKCTRQLPAGALTVQGAAGANQRPFAARIGKRRLVPGRYRVTVTATDAAGNVSPAKLASFIALPPRR